MNSLSKQIILNNPNFSNSFQPPQHCICQVEIEKQPITSFVIKVAATEQKSRSNRLRISFGRLLPPRSSNRKAAGYVFRRSGNVWKASTRSIPDGHTKSTDPISLSPSGIEGTSRSSGSRTRAGDVIWVVGG